jgi:hypothetical protein
LSKSSEDRNEKDISSQKEYLIDNIDAFGKMSNSEDRDPQEMSY